MKEILEVRPSLVAKNFMSHREEDGTLNANPKIYTFLHQNNCWPFDFDAVNITEEHEVEPETPRYMKIDEDGKTVRFNGLKFELSDEPNSITGKKTRTFVFLDERRIMYLLFIPGHVELDENDNMSEDMKKRSAMCSLSVDNIFGRLTFAVNPKLIKDIIEAEYEIDLVNKGIEQTLEQPQRLMIYRRLIEGRTPEEELRVQKIYSTALQILNTEGFSFDDKKDITTDDALYIVKGLMDPEEKEKLELMISENKLKPVLENNILKLVSEPLEAEKYSFDMEVTADALSKAFSGNTANDNSSGE